MEKNTSQLAFECCGQSLIARKQQNSGVLSCHVSPESCPVKLRLYGVLQSVISISYSAVLKKHNAEIHRR